MTFAAPLFAWGAAAIALATVALHLLAWRRPPATALPTARFAPERPVRMVSRAVRPSDLALLALRVVTVMLIGFALAGPVLARQPRGTARVVVVDRSRAVAPGTGIGDAARTVFRLGDAIVVYDSTAREIPMPTADSLAAPVSSAARGSLSAALVTATRAAQRLQRDYDSVAIVIVSPFAAEQIDAATASIRGLWSGRVERVRAGARPNAEVIAGRPAIRGRDDDPVLAALALAGELPAGDDVRVVRDSVTAADSAWAAPGRTLVAWPSVAPRQWSRATPADTALAVTIAGGSRLPTPDGSVRSATVVAPLVRDSRPPDGRVVARWSDGVPAATESSLGAGCVRTVAIAVPSVGDLALTPAFRHFVRRLVEPCGRAVRVSLASDTALATMLPEAAPAGADLVARAAGGKPLASPLTVWLLALALVTAFAETFVRRGEPHATD